MTTPMDDTFDLYDLRVAGADVITVDEWAQALGLPPAAEGDAAAAGGDA